MSTTNAVSSKRYRLLVANRGEIAARIIRTANSLGLHTIAIYTPSDALSTHVSLAHQAIPLPSNPKEPEPESTPYLSYETIIPICLEHSVTLVHPGYGFLSENAEFARKVMAAGITWIGPRPEIIQLMGLKHEARAAAVKAGVPVVPGSSGLVGTVADAVEVVKGIGYPVILKATAGGGGMGMTVCEDEESLKAQFSEIQSRSKGLFGSEGVIIERYFPAARHIEVQVFGDGLGNVVHMGERECSIQRRNQKIIEESPSPFVQSHPGPGLRDNLCSAAVKLCLLINYNSAGTVEFLVDDTNGDFYFLEMNTRIQVEHPVTEAVHPGLDLVKLMIEQAIAESSVSSSVTSETYGGSSLKPSAPRGPSHERPEMQQSTYDTKRNLHAIEGRVYAENPARNYLPTPGLLQLVDLCEGVYDWLRIDSWISTGLVITPQFDGLLCKIIVTGKSRGEATERFKRALELVKIWGPPNNVSLLWEIANSEVFGSGGCTTGFLAGFVFQSRSFTVISPGLESTIQDLPGRTTTTISPVGIPPGGPMDPLAFSAGNVIVGNSSPATEGLEIIVVPGLDFEVQFSVDAVVAVTGKHVNVSVDGEGVPMWARVAISFSGGQGQGQGGGRLRIYVENLDAGEDDGGTTTRSRSRSGFRVYLCVRGGFPHILGYLGSKSTSMGLGGYQGRSLLAGDQIDLESSGLSSGGLEQNKTDALLTLPPSLIPRYPTDWVVNVLPGPQDDPWFLEPEGAHAFYATKWRVSPASNRLGIRLEPLSSPEGEGKTQERKIKWSRADGGQGGSHPSNILDNGYAPGAVNINGDTPVILGKDGPDMGGYVSLCTVASAEMWKLGQVQPGNTIQFKRTSWLQSMELGRSVEQWIGKVEASVQGRLVVSKDDDHRSSRFPWDNDVSADMNVGEERGTILGEVGQGIVKATFRQAGDSAILVDFGPMIVDLEVRARIHAFQSIITDNKPVGLKFLCPCVRSIMCHYDPQRTSQAEFLSALLATHQQLPGSVQDMEFKGRKITFPIVLDDPWNREALVLYTKTTRNKAVYLPSNITYLARNNGLKDDEEALRRLVESDWLVLGVGFYLGCPFLIPLDPRCRLVGQKMNPSRTYTPRGAIGIAGPIAAIYPVESPGGYQLYGRTLPTWHTWGKGVDFSPLKPWLLQPFDQVHFEPITTSQYTELERLFDAGQYEFKIEPATFSVENHTKFVASIAAEVVEFRHRQEMSSLLETKREQEYLIGWEAEKEANRNASATRVAGDDDDAVESATIKASLFASIWKVRVGPGHTITSADDVLLILEAMKTEIPVKAGAGNVGKIIKRLGKGVAEGKSVKAGDVLFILT